MPVLQDNTVLRLDLDSGFDRDELTHRLVGVARAVLLSPAEVKYCLIKPLFIPAPRNAPSNDFHFPVSITLTPKGFFLTFIYGYAFLFDT